VILRLTPKTAALVGETPAEWQLLEKQVRASRWTTGARAMPLFEEPSARPFQELNLARHDLGSLGHQCAEVFFDVCRSGLG
jgi:hypothetical protein